MQDYSAQAIAWQEAVRELIHTSYNSLPPFGLRGVSGIDPQVIAHHSLTPGDALVHR